MLRSAGLANINVDLIAGLPGQTRASWSESLSWIERLQPPHVSVYMLEIDEDSRLGSEVLLNGKRYGAPDVPSDELTAEFYETAVERLSRMGIQRYEISNFARPGFESLHNLKYWQLEPYAGFGADAHSFDGAVRGQNIESPSDYVERIGSGQSAAHRHHARQCRRRALLRRTAPHARHPAAGRRVAQVRTAHPALHRRRSAGARRLTAAADGPRRAIFERSFCRIHHMMIDLRSDTVTRPTPQMRRAMAEAEVGDDVYREDPTVNRLEKRAAEIMGKEAGLFVPTGTMGNTIAVKMHTDHGQEVICESRAHLLDWELSMLAWFSGCLIRAVPSSDGILHWKDIEAAIRPTSAHCAPTTLIEIENTHNMAGGAVYPMDVFEDICANAHKRGIKVHLDGARIFNAACHLNRPVRDLAAPADSVMFCLSKGLGAPVGSMLVGTAEAIDRARGYRKRLGGGMRQAGVLAAAGLIALEEMPHRLGEDHANARFLAGELAKLPGIQIDPARVQTNIVIFDVTATGLATTELTAALKPRGVLMNGINPRQMRAVTHFDVSRQQCATADRRQFPKCSLQSSSFRVNLRASGSSKGHARRPHHLSQPAQATGVFLRRRIHSDARHWRK